MRKPATLHLGIGLLLFILFFAFVVPYLHPLSEHVTNLSAKNMPPSLIHPFGTDDLGRDLMLRVCSAVRLSTTVGLLAGLVDVIIGVLWGMLAALSTYKIGQMMMAFADVLFSIPYLLVVLLLSVVVGQGFTPIFIAMVLVGWVQMARIVHGQTVNILQSEYILSARIMGASPLRIFFHHMLPNMAGPILAATVLSIPQAIFSEAFLSFLGIGIQPPTASLGSLVADALPALRYYPWRLLCPSAAISFLVLALTLISDGLREYYDPKAVAWS